MPASQERWEEEGMEGTLASRLRTEALFKCARFTLEMSLLWEVATSLSYRLGALENVKSQGILESKQEHG